MTRSFSLTAGALVLPALWIAVGLTTGCGSPPPAPAPAASQPAAADHADGAELNRHAVEGHDHAPGPHGGTIVDWGGGTYHVEFMVDHDKREAVAYVLGPDEKTLTPIKAADGGLLLTLTEPAVQLTLTPRPLADETAGACSCFVGTDDTLGIVREFAGTISGLVDGTPYAGDFAEEAHDHEGHEGE